MLLPRNHGSAVGELLALHLHETDALETHAINDAGGQAILCRDLEAFIAEREGELSRQEAEFLDRFGLKIGNDMDRSDEEVDIDE